MTDYKVSKEEIIALRKLIPVGVFYAKKLLFNSKGSLEESRKIYLEEEIFRLSQETGVDQVKVGELFFENDYNSQHTLDAIHDYEFDLAFSKAKIKTLPKDFKQFDDWLEVVKKNGLMRSLQSKDFDSVFTVIYDTGYVDFAEALIEAHIFLHNKEIFLRGLEDGELIEAVADLKTDVVYLKAVEQFKLNVLLDPEFLKVIARLRKNVEG